MKEQKCQNAELSASWSDFFKQQEELDYYPKLKDFLRQERKSFTVYPPKGQVFAALKATPLDKLKVVIVGQDPYHGPGQAHGLSFSVPKACPLPPSLRNIFQEISNDLKIPMGKQGDLTKWAEQGVLLLNTLLTVRSGQPMSHQGRGWEDFTDELIKYCCLKKRGLIFLLWGKSAKDKVQRCLKMLPCEHMPTILSSAHPSPLSAHRGFLGCKHFSKTNEILIAQGSSPIDWKN